MPPATELLTHPLTLCSHSQDYLILSQTISVSDYGTLGQNSITYYLDRFGANIQICETSNYILNNICVSPLVLEC